MKTLHPFGNYILVEPVQRQTMFVVQDGALCEYGHVIAIGDEVRKIKVGDLIGFLVWGMQKLEIEDKTHYLIPEGQFILGTFEE